MKWNIFSNFELLEKMGMSSVPTVLMSSDMLMALALCLPPMSLFLFNTLTTAKMLPVLLVFLVVIYLDQHSHTWTINTER